jgi:hypothetical protein
LKNSPTRPRVFLGSSTEGLLVAQQLERRLSRLADIVLWRDAFKPGDVVIERLHTEALACDYAVLVATADDLTFMRGRSSKTARDNVIFEAGLFIGRLGLKRAFVVCDKNARGPTDLNGVTFVMFDPAPQNLANSLNQAASRIADALRAGRFSGDFVTSYLSLFGADDKPLTHAELLRKHYGRLRQEVRALVDLGAWGRIAWINSRVRELFEYAGLYREGAEFGEELTAALRKAGQFLEADWVRVKNVA